MSLPVRAVQRLRARSRGEEGISLLEVIVALMIIAVVMTSAAGFFLNSLKTTGGASQRQTAVTLVNQELESIRAVPPGSLLTGRTDKTAPGTNSIGPLFAWSGAADLTALDDTSNSQSGANNYDTKATAATIPAVPPITQPIVNNKTYTLYNFIDPCWLAVGQAPSTDVSQLKCGATYSSESGKTTSMMFRVTVAGTWTGGAATNCTNGCSYSASSLVDPNAEPLFQSNVSKPTITGISPNSIAANMTTTIVVSGAGFVSGATATTCSNATVGTIDQSKNTGTSIQIPIIAGNNVSSCTLTITNPDGGNVSTTFVISSPPSITSVSPAVQNYTSGNITITGTNFGAVTVGTSSGAWSGTNGSGTTQITGTYAASAPSAGGVPVTVTNSDGGSATANITVTQSTPTVTITSATSIIAGSTSTVTMNGSDLAPSGETVVPTDGAVSSVNGSSSGVSFSYAAASATGTVTFTVSNPDGGSTTASVNILPVPAPSISNVNYTITPYCGGSCGKVRYNVTFTVTGDNFTDPSSATVNSPGNNNVGDKTVSSGGVTVVSSTQATFTISYGNNPTGATLYVIVKTASGPSNSVLGSAS